MKSLLLASATLVAVFTVACASSAPKAESHPATVRLLGQDAGVRVDASVLPNLADSTVFNISYDIENLRDQAIAVADLVPETTYDAESRTVTVSFGSEVPGNHLLPRLVRVDPGVKKTFKGKASLDFARRNRNLAAPPRYLQVRINFLDDIRPFAKVIDIPEHAIADPQLADALFPQWVEHNVAIITNSMPIRLDLKPFAGDIQQQP